MQFKFFYLFIYFLSNVLKSLITCFFVFTSNLHELQLFTIKLKIELRTSSILLKSFTIRVNLVAYVGAIEIELFV
jgi:hypothetical protein